ncbi:MAG: hypothetical protein CMK59_09135 [Proteobacteria bacterium]|nr:hypothetical protein [Pseudomonadota bacterium]
MLNYALNTLNASTNQLIIPKGSGLLSFRQAGTQAPFQDIHPQTTFSENPDKNLLEWSWHKDLEVRLEIHTLGPWFFLLGPVFAEISISQSVEISNDFWEKIVSLKPIALQMEWRKLSDQDLTELSRIDTIKTLKVHWCTFNGSLDFIKGLPLRSFEVWGCNLTSIDALENLSKLHSLKLCANSLTGEKLSQIRLSSSLQYLWLWQNPITDDGLKALSKCTNLRLLEMPQTSIEGWGLAPLVKMNEIRHLSFEQTPLENAALSFLNPMPHLKHLNIRGTKITSERVNIWLAERPYSQIEIQHI